jgi:copper chaperone
MKNEKISIQGMSCGHCAMAVKKALSKLPIEVKDVKVGSADVSYDETKVNRQVIVETIEEAGYKVQ